ncbi:MAG: hypothetical protein IJ155_02250 [Prevotella sp.]|nr:hypothetical protein [Prevotella sp.]
MKKFFCVAALAVVSLCAEAQFVLTPSSGLMTEDGPYIIMREGTEVENYEAAMQAVGRAIPNAEIGEVEYEKSFNVTSAFKERRKLPGAIVATDWNTGYTLFVECAEGKIMVSFKQIGPLEASKKGEVIMNVYPTTGKNSMLMGVSGIQYIFNSKGVVAKGCKKMKEIFEDYANTLVKDIENNLK